MRRTSPRPAQPNESLIGGLECLQALAGAGRSIGSREMARMLGMEHTRVNRLMGTLASLGLAERTPERRYAPGPGLHVLAAMSLRGSRLLSTALPHLDRLHQLEPKLTLALGVIWRRHVVYLYFARPGSDPRVAIAGADLFPAERSSIGRMLLSAMPHDEIRRLYADMPAATLDVLTANLKRHARDGWALVEETTLGVAVGSPPVAGMAFSDSSIPRRRKELVRRLQETASLIAHQLELSNMKESLP